MLLLRDKTNVAFAFDSVAFPKQTTVHTHTHLHTQIREILCLLQKCLMQSGCLKEKYEISHMLT